MDPSPRMELPEELDDGCHLHGMRQVRLIIRPFAIPGGGRAAALIRCARVAGLRHSWRWEGKRKAVASELREALIK